MLAGLLRVMKMGDVIAALGAIIDADLVADPDFDGIHTIAAEELLD